MSSPEPQLETTPARSVSLYMCVAGAGASIDFYREAFGAKELMRLTEPDGKIGHAEIQIGDTVVMISDEYPDYGVLSPQTIGGSSVRLHLDVADVDTFAERAIKAGVTPFTSVLLRSSPLSSSVSTFAQGALSGLRPLGFNQNLLATHFIANLRLAASSSS